MSNTEQRRFKRGDVREDGKVFWRYEKKFLNGECWVTSEQFSSYSSSALERSRRHRSRNPNSDQEYYLRNKLSLLQAQKEYVRKNHAKVAFRRREHYKRNREAVLYKCRIYREKYPDKSRAATKQWLDARPGIVNAYSASRRARVKRASAHLSSDSEALIRCLYQQSRRVSGCLGIPFHVDHRLPLKPRDPLSAGLHEPSNLQILPAKINLRKSNKLDFYYPETVAA